MSSLLYIHCIGSLVNLFEPSNYVSFWIRNGNRSADEEFCPKRSRTNDLQYTYQNMWSLLNQKQ